MMGVVMMMRCFVIVVALLSSNKASPPLVTSIQCSERRAVGMVGNKEADLE